jgi:hypothetical protein|tara:strand:- start:1373 stop:1801 length:429 start_codon:yes stop_codon:yes gene_type:complete
LKWPVTFESRLDSWNQLRKQVTEQPVELALETINSWWFQTPWTAYHLHWDDHLSWPDPWQLLSDNLYCEVARGLGILYTITLLDRGDMDSAELVLTKDDRNLVLLDKSKYILNWDKTNILNTSTGIEIKKSLHQSQVKQKYK